MDELSKVSGRSAEDGALTLTTATSVEGSEPTIVAGYEAPLEKPTRIPCAPWMTCSFVTTSPRLSIKKPDPSEPTRSFDGGRKKDPGTVWVLVSVIRTTDGASSR